jgi:hypothetical protein
MPENVRNADTVIEPACQDEECVGKPVQEGNHWPDTGAAVAQRHHLALGAAADGPGLVGQRGRTGSGGQHEVPELWELRFHRVDPPLEPLGFDHALREHGPARRIGEESPDLEEKSLRPLELWSDLWRQILGTKHADDSVQLVQIAVRGDSTVGLRDPCSVGEAGGAVIAGARVNLHRAMVPPASRPGRARGGTLRMTSNYRLLS